MPSVSRAASRMLWLCEEGDVGYDQRERWTMDPEAGGGETDCSAMVIAVLRWAGFDTGGASYTGDMEGELCARGWESLPPDVSACRVGDVLLNRARHVCMVVDGAGWSATIAQASIDENGSAHGGAAGDQTGRETNTRPVYDYPWDCILRYAGEDDDEGDEVRAEDIQAIAQAVAEYFYIDGSTPAGYAAGVRNPNIYNLLSDTRKFSGWDYRNERAGDRVDMHQMLVDVHKNVSTLSKRLDGIEKRLR